MIDTLQKRHARGIIEQNTTRTLVPRMNTSTPCLIRSRLQSHLLWNNRQTPSQILQTQMPRVHPVDYDFASFCRLHQSVKCCQKGGFPRPRPSYYANTSA